MLWGNGLEAQNKKITLNTAVIFNLLAIKEWAYQDLAREVGVSNAYISQLIKHQRRPSIPMVGRLARALGVEPHEITFGLISPPLWNDDKTLTREETTMLRFLAQHDELSKLILKLAFRYQALPEQN